MGLLDFLKRGNPSMGISAEDAQRTDIQDSLSAVREKRAEIDNISEKTKQSLREFKIDMLRQIYQEMETLGVDPSNLMQVREFLQKLESIDPDLVELFENAMNALDPDAEATEEELPPGAEGLMEDGEEQMMPQEGEMMPQEESEEGQPMQPLM